MNVVDCVNQNTNEYAIRNLWPTEKLAEALIQHVREETVDYDWEENPIPGFMEDFYITSDGQEFSIYEDAVKYEVWWLKQECNAGG